MPTLPTGPARRTTRSTGRGLLLGTLLVVALAACGDDDGGGGGAAVDNTTATSGVPASTTPTTEVVTDVAVTLQPTISETLELSATFAVVNNRPDDVVVTEPTVGQVEDTEAADLRMVSVRPEVDPGEEDAVASPFSFAGIVVGAGQTFEIDVYLGTRPARPDSVDLCVEVVSPAEVVSGEATHGAVVELDGPAPGTVAELTCSGPTPIA